MNQREYDRDTAILTARLITSNKYIVIDTETTGLVEPEACQVAWVTETGERFGTFVKPSKEIETATTAFHHISNEMVKDAKSMSDWMPTLTDLSRGRFVLFYNAPFDCGVIERSIKAPYRPDNLYDVMLLFSAFVGTWDSFHGNYKWHKLGTAISMLGIKTDETLHDASTDAYMTRELLLIMAKQSTTGEVKAFVDLVNEEQNGN